MNSKPTQHTSYYSPLPQKTDPAIIHSTPPRMVARTSSNNTDSGYQTLGTRQHVRLEQQLAPIEPEDSAWTITTAYLQSQSSQSRMILPRERLPSKKQGKPPREILHHMEPNTLPWKTYHKFLRCILNHHDPPNKPTSTIPDTLEFQNNLDGQPPQIRQNVEIAT